MCSQRSFSECLATLCSITAILLDCQKLQSKVILIKNVLDPLY